MTMRTLNHPFRLGIGRGLALGLACCAALAACVGSGGDSSSGTGGAPAATGSGGASTSSGGAPFQSSSGGAPVSNGSGGAVPVSSGGSGTGGTPDMTGSGGALPTSSGGVTGSAGAPGSGGASPVGGSKGTGATSAGGSSGSVGGSSAPGACAGVFCDGFESGTTLGSAWTVDNAVTGNVVEVVTTMKHSGNNAVHMKFGTGQGATFIHETMGFPAPMNSLWGRVWVYYMTDPSSAGHDVYIEASDGIMNTQHGVRPLNTQGGSMTINVDPSTVGGAGETSASANKPLPRGAWTCFEWQIAATGGSGSVTLYMGGTQLATVPKVGIPNLVYMRVGYEHYAADKAGGEMWLDDYAIGTTRQNCM